MRRSVFNAPHISKCLASSYGGMGFVGVGTPRKISLPAVVTSNKVYYAEIPKVAPSLPPASSSSSNINMNERPTQEQMQKVYNSLQNSLPKLFVQPMDYSVYNADIVFINNIRNKTTQGIVKYVQQVALLRTVGHLKFAYVKLEVLNMSLSEEECRITVRWRIKGISGFRVMLKFWKFKLWKWREIMDQQENWYDGISYFDVGPDGTIYRHIADRVIEDKERHRVTVSKAPLAAKMGVLAALLPQPGLQDVFIIKSLLSYIKWRLFIHSIVPLSSFSPHCRKNVDK